MVECDASSPHYLFDFGGEPTVSERNTFIALLPPEPLEELCRASTEPGSVSRSIADENEDVVEEPAFPNLPPPPPLELEAFDTYDSFDEPVENGVPSASAAATTVAADCVWRITPEGPHGFCSSYATSPGMRQGQSPCESVEGRVVYEWHDSPALFTSGGSPTHVLAGDMGCLAEQYFMPMPNDIPMPLPLLSRAPMVPPPPPSLPAPCVGAPSEPPDVPASLVHEADQVEAPANDVSALEIARQPSGITCTVLGNVHHVSWQVDAKKLESQDKQAVSPQFIIDLPELGPQPFKIALYPKIVNDGKRGASFKKAKGKGKVLLKCEAQLPQDSPELGFRIGIGRGDKLQVPRGPVAHNFSEQSMRGLAKGEEDWDFHAAVDESGTFVVSLTLAPSVASLTSPTWCWGGTRVVR